mmetsp:Transcript_81787/g.219871  ORF Transcript_81787/g.219871 Transcript_81787/m.219871 type:complete len:239 (+) Transcript_81787:539-1255(+)
MVAWLQEIKSLTMYVLQMRVPRGKRACSGPAKHTTPNPCTRASVGHDCVEIIVGEGVVAGREYGEGTRRRRGASGLLPGGVPRIGEAGGEVVAPWQGRAGAYTFTVARVDVQAARRVTRGESCQRVGHMEEAHAHTDHHGPGDPARGSRVRAHSGCQRITSSGVSATNSCTTGVVQHHCVIHILSESVITACTHSERALGNSAASCLRPRREPRIAIPGLEVVPPWEGRVGADTFARA